MDINKLNPALLEALKNEGLIDKEEHKLLLEQSKSRCDVWLDKFITTYDSMVRMKQRVRTLAFCNEPVLIFGETGTGKELIANADSDCREAELRECINGLERIKNFDLGSYSRKEDMWDAAGKMIAVAESTLASRLLAKPAKESNNKESNETK